MLKKILYQLKKEYVIVIFSVFAFLLYTTNLSGQGFSLDEPETVTVAKTIGTNLIPTAWDGKGLIAGIDDKGYMQIGNLYIWNWHPWLQYYITYSAMNVFGNNVAAMRIPFAIFGVLTIIVVYYLSKELFRNKNVALITSTYLTLLVPFFLYSRQIRYYSITAFFSVISFWLFIRIASDSKRKINLKIFSLVTVMLFLSNYVAWLSSIAALFVVSFLKKRYKIVNIILLQVIFALLWFAILKPFGGDASYFWNKSYGLLNNLIIYAGYINKAIFPLILLPFAFLLIKYSKEIFLVFIWILIKLLVHSVFFDPHGRYIVDLFPIFILLYGFIIKYLNEKGVSKLFTLIFIIATLFTNLLNISPVTSSNNFSKEYKFIPKLIKSELSGKYKSMMPQLGKYLKENYNSGDLFWSNKYRWYIYHYAGVPHLSTVCDREKDRLKGPSSIVKIENVRWFIFFQDEEGQINDPSGFCEGERLKDYLNSNFSKRTFAFDDFTYMVNDVDVMNRLFPPYTIKNNQVVIYEKIIQ